MTECQTNTQTLDLAEIILLAHCLAMCEETIETYDKELADFLDKVNISDPKTPKEQQ